MKAIAVTGTPACGKTRLSKSLAKLLDYEYLDLTPFLVKNKIHEGYDRSLKTYMISIPKMRKFLEPLLAKGDKKVGIIIDGHLSHELSPKVINKVVVVKCDPKVLHKRLLLRKYSKKKLQENIDSEVIGVCEQEARELKHKVIVVDGTSFLHGNLEKMLKKITGKTVKRAKNKK